MQRNRHIDTRNKLTSEELAQQTEAALEELENIINAKVADYQIKNPASTHIFLDAATNYLYVFNTTTKEWIEYHPA